jgi:hypothetical protein
MQIVELLVSVSNPPRDLGRRNLGIKETDFYFLKTLPFPCYEPYTQASRAQHTHQCTLNPFALLPCRPVFLLLCILILIPYSGRKAKLEQQANIYSALAGRGTDLRTLVEEQRLARAFNTCLRSSLTSRLAVSRSLLGLCWPWTAQRPFCLFVSFVAQLTWASVGPLPDLLGYA